MAIQPNNPATKFPRFTKHSENYAIKEISNHFFQQTFHHFATFMMVHMIFRFFALIVNTSFKSIIVFHHDWFWKSTNLILQYWTRPIKKFEFNMFCEKKGNEQNNFWQSYYTIRKLWEVFGFQWTVQNIFSRLTITKNNNFS